MKNDMSKLLKIGKKLSKDNKDLSKEYKEDIREQLCTNKDFIEFCKNKKDWNNEEHDYLKNILELPKNENGFYKDIYGYRVSYNGARNLRREGTELPLTEIHENEILKCKTDFDYFRRYYTLITTRTGISRPEHRDYQIEFWDILENLHDTVCMLPRQSSKTVSTAIYFLWRLIERETPINMGITAFKADTAREILDKIKKIYQEMPIWLQPNISVWNKGEIEIENNSRIMTSAANDGAYRGYTVNLLLIDECAYIPKTDFDAFLDSVIPTMNSLIFKQVIYVSTPNGVNHFAELVKQAQMPKSSMTYFTTSWRNVPHYGKDGKLLNPEDFKEQTIQDFGMQFWLQTQECEFLGSSSTLINSQTLSRIQKHIESLDTNDFPISIFEGLTTYKTPTKGHSYICSVDSSKDGIDDFSINVIDITKFPFEQVADANLQVDYILMGEYLDELGKYYNNALIVVENNEGSGQSISDTLWNIYSYENMYRDKNIDGKPGFKRYTGFRTTPKSRSVILGLLRAFLEEDKLILNSEESLQQLYTFTKNDSDKYVAQDGYKDDNVMSLAIAFAPFMESIKFDDFELFINQLRKETPEVKTKEFMSVLDLSFDDDGEDHSTNYERTKKAIEEMGILSQFDEYGIPESMSDNLRDHWS